MKIEDFLKENIIKLEQKKIKEARLELELIISFVLKKRREELILDLKKELNDIDLKKINLILKKRLQNWPLPYLLKNKAFYNLDFVVNKNTLIPRPESEIIVDELIKRLNKNKKNLIIDIGTGSACIIVSVADLLKNNKNISFYGLDISEKALFIAKKNSKINNCEKKIKFFKSDLLKDFLEKNKIDKFEELHLIANLPYLTRKEIKESPSIQLEPEIALYGGRDGLSLYKKLIKQIKNIKKEDNKIFLYQEISPWQKKYLIEINKKAINKKSLKLEIIKDLRKKERIIISSF